MCQLCAGGNSLKLSVSTCDQPHCRAYGQSVTFRFREFYQFSQGFGSEDLVLGLGILVLEHLVLKKTFRFRSKYWSRHTVPLWGVFIGPGHCLAFSVLWTLDWRDSWLVDEDADSKVVDVAADIEESIGNTFVTFNSLTTMFSQFYDESK